MTTSMTTSPISARSIISLSNKLPAELRQAIADAKEGKKGAKKILVLINPPYAEATGGGLAVPMTY